MKEIGLSSLVAGLLMANVAGADPVAVKDGAVFIAGNNALTVQAADESVGLPGGCAVSHPVNGASDVVISGGTAFVTTNNAGIVDVARVDVSACLVSTNTCDIEPTVDLNNGVLLIPCLEANGQVYDITMHQRGNSMNWEVTGIEDSRHHGRDDN